jgi:HK97 family phage major capsid protein
MTVLTTTLADRGWSPDISWHTPGDAVPDALILRTSTVAANVEGDAPAVRALTVDDDEATFVPEGQTIDTAQPQLAETLVNTAKLSQLIVVSRELLAQVDVSAQLAASVRRAVTRAGNAAYIAQPAPTPPAVAPSAGLINTTGIVDLGTVGENLDALVDGLAILAENYATPTHVVVAPSTWAALQRIKVGADSNASLLGAGTSAAEPFLLNLPVIVDASVPAGKGLVVDSTAIISAVGPVSVAKSEHAYFSSDRIALRCNWRIGWAAVRPERLGVFEIDDGS